MDNSVRIFISYRRDDSFMRSEDDRAPNYAFVQKLQSVLRDAGFYHVFVDIDEALFGLDVVRF